MIPFRILGRLRHRPGDISPDGAQLESTVQERNERGREQCVRSRYHEQQHEHGSDPCDISEWLPLGLPQNVHLAPLAIIPAELTYFIFLAACQMACARATWWCTGSPSFTSSLQQCWCGEFVAFGSFASSASCVHFFLRQRQLISDQCIT